MIELLRDVEYSIARAALIHAAAQFIKSPIIESGVEITTEVEELSNSILKELSSRLSLFGPTDSLLNSEELLVALSNEIIDFGLQDASDSLILTRLGQKGLIQPGEYDLQFHESFHDYIGRFGIRKNHVALAVREADRFEHHKPQIEVTDSDFYFSLFTKTYSGKDAEQQFTIIVDAIRRGKVLLVQRTWKAFHDLLEPRRLNSPMEFLKRFLEIFGEDLILGKNPPTRYIQYESFVVDSPPDASVSILAFRHPGQADLDIKQNIRPSGVGVIEVANTYAVNITKYSDSFKKHGIRIAPPSNTKGADG